MRSICPASGTQPAARLHTTSSHLHANCSALPSLPPPVILLHDTGDTAAKGGHQPIVQRKKKQQQQHQLRKHPPRLTVIHIRCDVPSSLSLLPFPPPRPHLRISSHHTRLLDGIFAVQHTCSDTCEFSTLHPSAHARDSTMMPMCV